MARTELDNGVILPAEYSDDWYEDMTSNLTKLDDVIGSDSEKLNADGVYFLRMYSAALTDSGTGNFSNLNSSYKIKTGDLVLDSGRKLYQIVSVDSANETFTVGNSLYKITAESDLALVATSGDYGDLDNKPNLSPYDQHLANTDIHVTAADKQKWNNGVSQSYVLRYSSTAITDNSTIAYSTLDNTDNIKADDKIIDVDGKIFSVVSVDSDNSTVTVGSALIDIALDANVVHTNEINSSGIGIIGAVKEVGGVNYNTLTTQGLYGANASGSTNGPENSPCVVQVIKRQNSVIQIASSANYQSRYIRYCVDITAQPPVWQSWIKFATDDNVMHLSGNETSTGNKTFSDLTTFNSYLYFTNSSVTKGTIPQTSVTPYRIYFGSGVNYGASLFNIDTSVSNTGVQTLTLRSAENVVGGDDTRMMLVYDPNRARPRYLAVKGGIEPNANNTYDCGSGTNIWKDLYSYHGYFMGQNQNDEYSSNTRTNLTLLSNRDTLGVSGVLFDTYRQNTAQGTGIHILGLSIKENSVRYEGCRWGWHWDNNLNGYTFDFKPTIQGANQAVKHNLGTSTDKWDTINGINPGSLSFPKLSSGLDISSYITVNGGNKESLYTPLSDGWISVALTRSGGANMAVMLKQGNFASSGHNIQQENGTTTCNAMLPVVGGVQVSINSALADGIYFAYFYPCQGNV